MLQRERKLCKCEIHIYSFFFSDLNLLTATLAVFLIQNSQNRDGAAMQAKLDELIRAIEGAQATRRGVKWNEVADAVVRSPRKRRALPMPTWRHARVGDACGAPLTITPEQRKAGIDHCISSGSDETRVAHSTRSTIPHTRGAQTRRGSI